MNNSRPFTKSVRYSFFKKHVDKDSLTILPFEKHVIWPIYAGKTTLTKYVLRVNIIMNYPLMNCGHTLSAKGHQLPFRSVKFKCAKMQNIPFVFYLGISKTRNFTVDILKSNVIHNGTAVLWKESRQNPLSKIKLKLPSPNVKLKLWAKLFSHIRIIGLKPVILSSYKTGF